MNRKKKNKFLKNVHYVQPEKSLLRWNIDELEKWFMCGEESVNNIDYNNNEDLERYLK